VRLEVPASSVGLEGQTVLGMSFSIYNGRATWDAAGKAPASALTSSASSPTSTTTPSTNTTTSTSPTTTTTTTSTVDTVWFDDALPTGVSPSSNGGDAWTWVMGSPAPYSGSLAHQSSVGAGLHEHAFYSWGSASFPIGTGDTIFVYVYLDPANTPSEIMLSFAADNWEHRVFWGADQIGYGTSGTASRYRAGALPAAGQWVRLEVPASAVGLGGQTIKGMSFSQYNGRATWDKFGKGTITTTSTPPTTTTTSTTTTTTPTTSGVDFVWVDDALPAGASGAGSGGDTWNWVTSSPAPYTGGKAHQSAVASGLHEHAFNWASNKMTLAAGDVIYTYVYLDPLNLPSTIMLSFGSDNWEHRVYWGADTINYGTRGTAGHYNGGALPVAGQWVRLEVPAAAVGLVGQSVQAMSFSTYNGRVTFDKTGKVSPAQ